MKLSSRRMHLKQERVLFSWSGRALTLHPLAVPLPTALVVQNRIDINNRMPCFVDQVTNDCRPDKTGATGNQDGMPLLHGKRPVVNPAPINPASITPSITPAPAACSPALLNQLPPLTSVIFNGMIRLQASQMLCS